MTTSRPYSFSRACQHVSLDEDAVCILSSRSLLGWRPKLTSAPRSKVHGWPPYACPLARTCARRVWDVSPRPQDPPNGGELTPTVDHCPGAHPHAPAWPRTCLHVDGNPWGVRMMTS